MSRARDAVRDYADRLGARSDDVMLAVSEAVSNAICHGYPDQPDGTITIDAHPNGGTLAVTVSDRGRGMGPLPSTRGLGIGLPLIGRLASSVEIAKGNNGRGTQIAMRFECA